MMGEGGLDSRGVPAGTPTATRAARAPIRDDIPKRTTAVKAVFLSWASG